MSCTDEDLKRVQEMGTVERERWIRGETRVAPLEALLARLEASEAVMKDYVEHGVLQCGPCMKRIEAWRKSCGR